MRSIRLLSPKTLALMASAIFLTNPASAQSISSGNLAVQGRVTVMALGDSNTFGWNVPEGYREPLVNLMNQNSLPIAMVGQQVDSRDPNFPNNRHEGYSGWTAEELLKGRDGLFPMNGVSQFQPDVILLMAGTNDFLQKSFSVDVATQNLVSLVSEVQKRSPHSLIIIATIFPMVDTSSNPRGGSIPNNDKGNEFNAFLKATYPAEFATTGKIKLIDMNTFMDYNWFGDGVHPNPIGYEAVGEAWYSVLAPLVATMTNHATPACVASADSRSYIMTSIRYVEGATQIPAQAIQARGILQSLNGKIGKLIQSNWDCAMTTETSNFVSTSLGSLQTSSAN